MNFVTERSLLYGQIGRGETVRKKRKLFFGAILFIAILGIFFYICRPKETVIEFAMFNGSNWDVAVQESYSVIDKAIEKFEKEHKGVKINLLRRNTKGRLQRVDV